MNEIRCKLEYREDESRLSPGRLVGTLLTYGERASDRPEVFEAGALDWPGNGIVLNRAHNDKVPIMRVIPEVRGSAVVIDTPLPDTTAGRDAAAELRAGLMRGLSVEFRATAARFVGGVRSIQHALLGGAGLVPAAAYAGSAVRGPQPAAALSGVEMRIPFFSRREESRRQPTGVHRPCARGAHGAAVGGRERPRSVGYRRGPVGRRHVGALHGGCRSRPAAPRHQRHGAEQGRVRLGHDRRVCLVR